MIKPYNFLQIWGKKREVIGIFGLLPNRLGVVEKHVIFDVLLGRNFGNLVVRLSEQLNLSPVHWVQLLKMGLQIRQEGFVFRVGI